MTPRHTLGIIVVFQSSSRGSTQYLKSQIVACILRHKPLFGLLSGLLSPADLEDGVLDTVVWYPIGRYAVFPKQVWTLAMSSN